MNFLRPFNAGPTNVCMCDRQTDRQTDRQISQKQRIPAGEVYRDDIGKMGRGSFWSWFDLNLSTFH